MMKYKPQTKEELITLLKNESIYLGDIDTSLITDMSDLFRLVNGTKRKNFKGIDKWDTSNVINMSYMFFCCEYFNENINCWNVSKVKNMAEMFNNTKSFNQPLNDWDVSNVTNMHEMFRGAYVFNQDLYKWNTSKVVTMFGMFFQCYEFNKNINSWNVSKVENMSYMFSRAKNFNQPLNDWDVSNVKDMIGMFSNCENFNQSLDDWNIDKVETMLNIFEGIDFNSLSLKWKLYLHVFNNNVLSKNIIKDNILEIYKIKTNNKKINFFKRRLENIYYNELKYIANYKIFKSIEEAENYALQNYNKNYDKKLNFIKDNNVLIKDKSRLVNIKVIKYIYAKYLELRDELYNVIEIDFIINLLDKETFLSYVKDLYVNVNNNITAIVYGIYGGNEALKNIHKRDSNLFINLLLLNKKTKYVIRKLYNIQIKQKNDSIEETLKDLANEHNLSIDDYAFKFLFNFGFNSKREKILNEEYKLILNDDYSLSLFNIKDNKRLKIIPNNLDKKLKEEINYLKKEIGTSLQSVYLSLRKYLLFEYKYDYNFFNEVFIKNVFMNKFASSFIWNLYDKDNVFVTTFIYSGDGSYSNCDDEEVKINNDAFISLANIYDMNKDTIKKWKNQLFDYEIVQPIHQFSIFELDKNNLKKYIEILENTEISYGSFKTFGTIYKMKANYMDNTVVDSYEFDNGIKIVIDSYSGINNKDKVNMKFENIEKSDNKFLYTLIMFMILDFNINYQ
ncbi:BspA family leucine-rich repeat surface protein [Brachyspira pulli]